MRLAALLPCLLLLAALPATERPALIPLPVEITWGGGEVAIAGLRESVEVKPGSVPAPTCADEAYELEVATSGIRIRANTERGVRHARATLAQLTRDGRSPAVAIRDWPAFPIRGLMHDVGRNFQSPAMVRRQIDLMARHKLNTFHWHLTDYHGWRVETRRNPGLNDPKSRDRKPQGQYSRDEVRELVAYAAARGVEVIPEMDMPGHSTYFRKGLGFDMQTPEGVAVLKGEIDDWVRLFPSRYFHLGSDEVAIRMKDFLPQMVGHVRSRGKIPVLWRPGGGIAGDDVVYQLWAKAAPPKGNPFIDSRYVYTNHMDPSEAPSQMFVQVAGRAATDGRALGAILCHWPDHVIGDEALTNRISPTWPVAVGFAESAWRGVAKDRKDLYAKAPRPDQPERAAFLDLERRIHTQRRVFVAAGEPFPFLPLAHIPWKVVAQPEAEATPPSAEAWDKATPAWGGTLYLNHHWHELPSWLPLTKAPTVAWARTFIHSEQAREVGLAIGFNAPSSSDTPRPEHRFVNGEWNPPGSEVRLNGAVVPAPAKWDMAGLTNKEQAAVPWTDASWFNRPPQKVRLKAGWNEILVRTPSHLEGKRLRKWMLTVVPAEWDAASASLVEVGGLRFAAEPR
jgi:hexosaminidase